MIAAKDDWIHRRAYELWEQEGRPEGAHLSHSQQASDEFDANGKRAKRRKLVKAGDRDEVALLHGAGENGEVDPAPAKPERKPRVSAASPTTEAKPANTEKPVRRKAKKAEGS